MHRKHCHIRQLYRFHSTSKVIIFTWQCHILPRNIQGLKGQFFCCASPVRNAFKFSNIVASIFSFLIHHCIFPLLQDNQTKVKHVQEMYKVQEVHFLWHKLWKTAKPYGKSMCFFIILFPRAKTDVITRSKILFCLHFLEPNSYSRQDITRQKTVQGLQYHLVSLAS